MKQQTMSRILNGKATPMHGN